VSKILITRGIMEKMSYEPMKEIFEKYVLSNDEMICVRGGDAEPIIKPTVPPVKI
jgi:hypothetical protein